MEVDEYARKVVTELLRPSVKHVIWAGGLTTIAWLLSWIGCEGILVRTICPARWHLVNNGIWVVQDGIYIKTNQLDKIRM